VSVYKFKLKFHKTTSYSEILKASAHILKTDSNFSTPTKKYLENVVLRLRFSFIFFHYNLIKENGEP
jgi:hypothetical protein